MNTAVTGSTNWSGATAMHKIILTAIVGVILILGYGGSCSKGDDGVDSGSSGDFDIITPVNGATTGLQPTFSWTAYPAAHTSYTLQISLDADFTVPLFYENTSISPTATYFQVGSGVLQADTAYYWRVLAVNSGTGISKVALNAPFAFVTGIIPGNFSLISPVDTDTLYTTTPLLVWSSASQAAGYNIQIDTENAFNNPKTFEIDLPVTNSYQVPASRLITGITYYWRVSAWSTGGSTVAGNAPFSFIVAPAPDAFALSQPIDSAITTTTPTFSCTAAIYALNYRLEVSASSSFVPMVYTTTGTATTYVMPGGTLSNNTPYYWRMIAINPAGETLAANRFFSFTTEP